MQVSMPFGISDIKYGKPLGHTMYLHLNTNANTSFAELKKKKKKSVHWKMHTWKSAWVYCFIFRRTIQMKRWSDIGSDLTMHLKKWKKRLQFYNTA